MNEEQHTIITSNISLKTERKETEKSLMQKDRWYGEEDLGMRLNQHEGVKSIYFGNIRQNWLKDITKYYILYRRYQGKSFGTLREYIKAIQHFSRFLETQCVYYFTDITDEVLSSYLGNMHSLSEKTQKHRLSHIKIFFELGNSNNWFQISTYWFRGRLGDAKPKNNKINYIPNEVSSQIDIYLYLLAKPLQRMVLLLRALGLRGSELLQMRFDCLKQRMSGDWEIHFTNWKFKERHDVLPIVPELAEIIKEQQTYIRTHLGEDFEYLFCANTYESNGFKFFKAKSKVMLLQQFNIYLNQWAESCNICDESGKLWKFTSHQFRRTVATKMTNEGVRQYIIQRYLRHHSPDMMQHYAHILPSTFKKEIEGLHKRKKIVDVTGLEVSISNPEIENDIELRWLRSKMQPKALAMGFCARPQLLKPCPHANACMDCQHFRLDEDDLPTLTQHLERNQKLKEESERLGYIRQLKEIEQDEAKLINIIKSLENANG
ncbi:MAG: site-specific integrase [Symplocastrum torsivum CPER-KK1]|jgi:integrase|uniref:Site-specific integrase n=1 Tax=Symplocastrum torsivum CPER-KK1 TaxID=450513 RepID=A0A951PQM7_9CYAN|nr:site-specific integrase [Symplocastrum torsivum CPER-KK1]